MLKARYRVNFFFNFFLQFVFYTHTPQTSIHSAGACYMFKLVLQHALVDTYLSAQPDIQLKHVNYSMSTDIQKGLWKGQPEYLSAQPDIQLKQIFN